MTPEQEAEHIRMMTKICTKMDMLINDDGSTGIIPKIIENHTTLTHTVAKQADQISYWRGGIAAVAFLVLVFGVMLLTHILGGGK